MLRRGSATLVGLVSALLLIATTVPAQAFTLPTLFVKLTASPTLAHPGIILINPATNETLYEQDADIGRAPASVLKLFSMATVLNALSPDLTFKTTISETARPDTFIMTGSADPWITASPFEAQKYQRAFSPTLINKLLEAHPNLRSITLEYNNVYSKDIQILQHYFYGHLTIKPLQVSSTADATAPIATIESPPLEKIIEFTLLYSDNILADRLGRTASRAMGFGTTTAGLQLAFNKTLTDLNIPTTGFEIFDGNGLSHDTRVTVRQIGALLVAIKNNPKFKVILDGLPTSGETGTLKTRFVNDAPQAVGLVRAKTGWIDTSVSLAGFVRVGPDEYVFAVVANQIRNSEGARQAARVTIDQMLGSIAKPLN